MNCTHPAERRAVAMTRQTCLTSGHAVAVPAGLGCDRVPPGLSASNSPLNPIRELPLGSRWVWRMTARNSFTGGQLCRSTREKGP